MGKPLSDIFVSKVIQAEVLNRRVNWNSLLDKLAVAVINFPKKQSESFQSKCEVTAFHYADKIVVLCKQCLAENKTATIKKLG